MSKVPRVTEHARLRYLQRVSADAIDSVDEELRRMFRRGHRAARADVNGAARRHGEHLVVYQDGERPVIKTVLRASRADP